MTQTRLTNKSPNEHLLWPGDELYFTRFLKGYTLGPFSFLIYKVCILYRGDKKFLHGSLMDPPLWLPLLACWCLHDLPVHGVHSSGKTSAVKIISQHSCPQVSVPLCSSFLPGLEFKSQFQARFVFRLSAPWKRKVQVPVPRADKLHSSSGFESFSNKPSFWKGRNWFVQRSSHPELYR